MKNEVLRVKELEIGSGTPKVLASITSQTLDGAARQAAAIKGSHAVDIAELRIDHLDPSLSDAQVIDVLNHCAAILAGKPLLATFRSKSEGGERDIPDTNYFALYRAIIVGAAVDLVDIEMMKPQWQISEVIALAHLKGIAVILSNHEWHVTPPRSVIVERLLRQQTLGADILKIATMPQSAEDVLTLMAASLEMKDRYARKPMLTMAMGPLGVATRLTGELTGSALTFASLGSASAPGQLDATAVKTVLNIIDQGARG